MCQMASATEGLGGVVDLDAGGAFTALELSEPCRDAPLAGFGLCLWRYGQRPGAGRGVVLTPARPRN